MPTRCLQVSTGPRPPATGCCSFKNSSVWTIWISCVEGTQSPGCAVIRAADGVQHSAEYGRPRGGRVGDERDLSPVGQTRHVRSRHVSCVITTSPRRVYDFASDPDNLPRWAAGLATSSIVHNDDSLLVESPMGTVIVRFVPRNEYGVTDHDVVLPSGTTVTNPMRVLAHPEGSEVVFTVRQIELSDEEFDRDCAMVERDLDELKRLMEQRP